MTRKTVRDLPGTENRIASILKSKQTRSAIAELANNQRTHFKA